MLRFVKRAVFKWMITSWRVCFSKVDNKSDICNDIIFYRMMKNQETLNFPLMVATFQEYYF